MHNWFAFMCYSENIGEKDYMCLANCWVEVGSCYSCSMSCIFFHNILLGRCTSSDIARIHVDSAWVVASIMVSFIILVFITDHKCHIDFMIMKKIFHFEKHCKCLGNILQCAFCYITGFLCLIDMIWKKLFNELDIPYLFL